MKKLIASIMILLLLAGISSCLQYGLGKPNAQKKTQALEKSDAQPSSSETTKPEESLQDTKDLKTDSGRYVGQADNNFIEVQISGVPDTKDFRIFMLSKELKEKFEAIQLETGDNIKFQYYINENDQNVMVSIEKI